MPKSLNQSTKVTYVTVVGTLKPARTLLVGLIVSATLVAATSETLAVYGGEDATGDSLVVSMLTERSDRRSHCSGALILERVVVSAAHCFVKSQSTTQELININSVIAQPGVDVRTDDVTTRLSVVEIIIMPTYINTWNPPQDRRTSIHDIAFLILEKPLVAGYRLPIATLEEVAGLKLRRDFVAHFGYGLTDQSTLSTRPQRIELRTRPRTFEYELTSPAEEQKTIISDETGSRALCPGDSGGPTYAQINGITKLVSVTSGASGCGGPGSGRGGTFGTVVAPYLELLDDRLTKYLALEDAIKKSREERTRLIEQNRVDGIKANTYYEVNDCHAAGVSAVLQSIDLGEWKDSASALGLRTKAECPASNPFTYWTVLASRPGTLLRWKLSTDAWTVFTGTFFANQSVTSSEPKRQQKSKIVSCVNTKTGKIKKLTSGSKTCSGIWRRI